MNQATKQKVPKPRSLSELISPLREPFESQKKRVLLTILSGWAKFIFPFFIPFSVGQVIDKVLDPWLAGVGDRAGLERTFIIYASLSLLAILATGIATFFRTKIGINMTAQLQHQLRRNLFHHVQRLSMEFFRKHRSGSLGSRVSYDINTASNLIDMGVVNYAMDIVTSTILLTILFFVNWQLSLLILCSLPFTIFSVKFFSPRLRSIQQSVQENQSRVTGHAVEFFSGISLVKAYAGERESELAFSQQSERVRDLQLKRADIQSVFASISQVISMLTPWAIVFIGTAIIIYSPGTLTKGELIAFLLYVGHLNFPISRMVDSFSTLQEGIAALERIADILEVLPNPPDAPNAIEPLLKGKVQFKNVNFSYQSKEATIGVTEIPPSETPLSKVVLNNFSFTFEAGKTYALVGPSGSGKSTLCQLLLRFYDPESGTILIDDHDLRQIRTEHYRRNVAVVLQDPVMFSTSVTNNIAFASEQVKLKEVMEAAKMAQAHDFIEKLPEGYETRLDERGVNLSGGQRQRIAIARALMREPKILILDEATSALDTLTETAIQNVIDGLRSTRTVIIIAHRLSTIRNADVVVVLKDGEVAETGSFEELIAKNGLFSDLIARQALEEKNT